MVVIVTADAMVFPMAGMDQNAGEKPWVTQRVIDSQGVTLVKHARTVEGPTPVN